MDAQTLLERAERLKALVEADGQITMRNLTPDEYTAKMNYANSLAGQNGNPAAQPVTPKDQIAMPTDLSTKVIYSQPQGGAGAPTGATAPKPQAKSDPKVLALQQKLIALGAKIKADGIMGPATQAAMKQFGLDINGNSTATNVAAPGQPPATLMKDTPAGQLQTKAAQQAKAQSAQDPTGTSLHSQTTVAQPTGPIAPTGINQGSGVGKNYQMTPDEMKAVADNGSDYDKQALSQTPGGAALMPMRGKKAKVSESLDRIIDLVKYLK